MCVLLVASVFRYPYLILKSIVRKERMPWKTLNETDDYLDAISLLALEQPHHCTEISGYDFKILEKFSSDIIAIQTLLEYLSSGRPLCGDSFHTSMGWYGYLLKEEVAFLSDALRDGLVTVRARKSKKEKEEILAVFRRSIDEVRKQNAELWLAVS